MTGNICEPGGGGPPPAALHFVCRAWALSPLHVLCRAFTRALSRLYTCFVAPLHVLCRAFTPALSRLYTCFVAPLHLPRHAAQLPFASAVRTRLPTRTPALSDPRCARPRLAPPSHVPMGSWPGPHRLLPAPSRRPGPSRPRLAGGRAAGRAHTRCPPAAPEGRGGAALA